MHPFAGGGLDRLAERRGDEGWLRERALDPATRLLPVWGTRNLVLPGEPPRAALLPPSALDGAGPGPGEWILLGERAGTTLFAVEVGGAEPPPLPGDLVELRGVAPLLEAEDGALLALARGMTYWHRRHRYCGECGSPARSALAGYERRCENPACSARHYPRVDPAVIVRIESGERCLLARQPEWPAGRYAVIAGFVEPGETLEEAVVREVREETGLEVLDVRYHSSQPWPFPSSLMVGFTARAAGEELRLDPAELEDARWLTREELREAMRRGEILPPFRLSIAHALLRDWYGAAL